MFSSFVVMRSSLQQLLHYCSDCIEQHQPTWLLPSFMQTLSRAGAEAATAAAAAAAPETVGAELDIFVCLGLQAGREVATEVTLLIRCLWTAAYCTYRRQ